MAAKEADLERAIQEYYRFDMTGLKNDVRKEFEKETSKVEEERQLKHKEIQQRFKTLTKLS